MTEMLSIFCSFQQAAARQKPTLVSPHLRLSSGGCETRVLDRPA